MKSYEVQPRKIYGAVVDAVTVKIAAFVDVVDAEAVPSADDALMPPETAVADDAPILLDVAVIDDVPTLLMPPAVTLPEIIVVVATAVVVVAAVVMVVEMVVVAAVFVSAGGCEAAFVIVDVGLAAGCKLFVVDN